MHEKMWCVGGVPVYQKDGNSTSGTEDSRETLLFVLNLVINLILLFLQSKEKGREKTKKIAIIGSLQVNVPEAKFVVSSMVRLERR